jgi:hypothetical protein
MSKLYLPTRPELEQWIETLKSDIEKAGTGYNGWRTRELKKAEQQLKDQRYESQG